MAAVLRGLGFQCRLMARLQPIGFQLSKVVVLRSGPQFQRKIPKSRKRPPPPRKPLSAQKKPKPSTPEPPSPSAHQFASSSEDKPKRGQKVLASQKAKGSGSEGRTDTGGDPQDNLREAQRLVMEAAAAAKVASSTSAPKLLNPKNPMTELWKGRWQKRQESQGSLGSDAEEHSELRDCDFWVEVYSEGRWIHIDGINGTVDCPTLYWDRGWDIFYVVAITDRVVMDVTRKYTSDMSKITPWRDNSPWWQESLDKLTVYVKGHHFTTEEEKQQTESEVHEMKKVQDKDPLPTSLQAYKNHPLYAIEKHLGKHEVIYPKDPVVGLVNGIQVFRRECVKKVMTKDKWFRDEDPRVVKQDQLETPAKINEYDPNKKKGKGKGKRTQGEEEQDKDQEADDDDADPEAEGEQDLLPVRTSRLYGEWQTEPYIPPSVGADGKVPRNEKGNWELWTAKHLPKGAIHMNLPGVNGVATALGIDHTLALTGFEAVMGRAIPVFEGIIVAAHQEELLLSALEQQQSKVAEEKERKQEQKILGLWKNLANFLMTRREVEQRFEEQYAKPAVTQQDGGGQRARPRGRSKKVLNKNQTTETID